MKKFILVTLLIPAVAFAHCPIAFEIKGEQYCANLNWLASDIKVQGKFQESHFLSPYLIPAGEVPPKWAYSKAEVLVWKKGDSTHAPQNPKDFRIFPYMIMESGMHHSAGHTLAYDQTTQSFVVQHLALQSMKGCWSLRWTTSSTDDIATSQLLSNVTDYTNLSDGENAAMATYCKNLVADDNDGHQH